MAREQWQEQAVAHQLQLVLADSYYCYCDQADEQSWQQQPRTAAADRNSTADTAAAAAAGIAADYDCDHRGEGEQEWPRLQLQLLAGRLPVRQLRRGHRADLDRLRLAYFDNDWTP